MPVVGVVPFRLMRDTSLSGSVRESCFFQLLNLAFRLTDGFLRLRPKGGDLHHRVHGENLGRSLFFSCLPQPDRHRAAANMSMKHRLMASSDSV